MSTHPTKNPLLDAPEEVSIKSRNDLFRAYHDHIAKLTDHFQAQTEQRTPAIPITVYYYSDNGGKLDDTAPKEINRALHDNANAVSVLSKIVPPTIVQENTLSMDWISGSFELAQTTRQGLSGVGNVTFLNCAPRLDERGQKGNTSNKGEPVYVGILPNGHVISANSRYNFTFFRDMIENGTLEVFEANVQPDGTQFRSRDIFPTHTIILANQLTENLHLWKPEMNLEQRRSLLSTIGYVDLDSPLQLDDIPELKQFTAAHLDVHGNIKTNTRFSELSQDVQDRLSSGTEFTVIANGQKLKGRMTERMFDRGDNEGGISKGSSGQAWQGAAHSDGFLEINIIGGSASEALGIDPADVKTQIEIQIPGIFEANDNNEEAPALEAPTNEGTLERWK